MSRWQGQCIGSGDPVADRAADYDNHDSDHQTRMQQCPPRFSRPVGRKGNALFCATTVGLPPSLLLPDRRAALAKKG